MTEKLIPISTLNVVINKHPALICCVVTQPDKARIGEIITESPFIA